MNRPRVPLGLEALRATLNRTACAALGQQLAAARRDRGLSISEVASLLMLSPAQVTALEDVRPDAFYGAEFYTQALRKYLHAMELPEGEATKVLVGPVETNRGPVFRRNTQAPPEPTADGRTRPWRSYVWSALGIGVVGLVAAGWWYLGTREAGPAESSTPATAEPVMVGDHGAAPPAESTDYPNDGPDTQPAVIPPPVAPTSTLQPVSAGRPGNLAGTITVAHPTWIFIRYLDNSTDERGLGPGETFTLRATPVYIAIGSAPGTAVVIGGHPIDTASFIVNGQVRIGRSGLTGPTAGG
jgi:hypothetical protein